VNLKIILFFTLMVVTSIIAKATISKNSEIRLLSYNVYFDDASGKVRYPEILAFIKSGKFNLIALQEATPYFLNLIKQDEYFKDFTVTIGDQQHGYTNLILTNQEVTHSGDINISSRMGRSAPFVILKESSLLISSIHLESGLSDTEKRIKQLNEVFSAISKYSNVILMGDFNFGDGEAEESIMSQFVDLGAKMKQVIYVVEGNSMAKKTKFFLEKSRRLDRIFVKCQTCLYSGFEVNNQPHSDHWAISTDLSVN